MFLGGTSRAGKAQLIQLGDKESLDLLEVLDVSSIGDGGDCGYAVTGRVVDSAGRTITGTQNDSVEVPMVRAGERRTHVGRNGEFALLVQDPNDVALSVDVGGCLYHYRKGTTMTVDMAERSVISLGKSGAAGLVLPVPHRACSRIVGRLVNAQVSGISGTGVWLSNARGDVAAQVNTDATGGFRFALYETGHYRIWTRIEGCTVYHRSGGATGSHRQATQVRLLDSDVTGITLQLAQDMCEHRISGKLLNADGSPQSGQWVSAIGNLGDAGASTTSDGSFSFAVPASDSYRLSVWLGNCSIRRGSRGPVKDWNSASQIQVSNADVTGIEFRLPEDPRPSATDGIRALRAVHGRPSQARAERLGRVGGWRRTVKRLESKPSCSQSGLVTCVWFALGERCRIEPLID